MNGRSVANGRVTKRGIVIAADDLARLETLLRLMVGADGQSGDRAALAGELRRARVVPRRDLPRDVVAMNSTVRLRDLETGEEETYTLVYPADADIESNKLSVLAPVGTALLGYRVGNVVEWPVPAGVLRFRIEEVIGTPSRAAVRVRA